MFYVSHVCGTDAGDAGDAAAAISINDIQCIFESHSRWNRNNGR